MLPVESLIEAVSFLPLYDLDSVLLANRELSAIASKCVKVIRAWSFEYVDFYVKKNSMFLIDMGTDDEDSGRDTRINVKGWENMTEVLDIALRNACFKVLTFFVDSNVVIPLPNKSALKVRKLHLRLKGVASADVLVDIIARFRKVK
ncbi:hypothetical protein AAVH_27750, partial [Aphelenchoides avenae]